MTEFERGWISALIDGEGSLSLYFSKQKTSNRPRVNCKITISNTDIKLLKYAQKIIGGSICKKPPKGNRKPSYVLSICSGILRDILPLPLIGKKKQQKILIRALQLLDGKNRGGTKTINGKRVGRTRPLWKDKKLAELKRQINLLNTRGRNHSNPKILIESNV